MTTTLHTPARVPRRTVPSLWGALAALSHGLGWPGRIVRARRLVAQLGTLDEHALRDIGLTRQDLHDAASTVFDTDPSLTLRRRVAERRLSRQGVARRR